MYVYTNSDEKLGKKASNIIKLDKYGYNIPKTYIISFDDREKFNLDKLNDKVDYIIRPSFDVEDKKQKSYAGFFKSFGPITKKEIKDVLSFSKSRFIDKESQCNYKLNSLIIQEYIRGKTYGVLFTRNPNNFFEEGGFEISKKSDGVTKGDGLEEINLSLFQKKRIKYLEKKLEKDFNYPQDVEFVFKNGNIYLLQTRDITTGYTSIYNFDMIKTFNGLYVNKNNGEFGNGPLVFTYSIIKKIYPDTLILGNNIYFRVGFISWIKLFLVDIKTNYKHLNFFVNKYRGYLFFKFLYGTIRKLFFFIELDKEKLNKIYGDYNYTFDLFEESQLIFDYDITKTNLLTRFLYFVEKKKNNAFKELYYFKKNILKESKLGKDIKYLKLEELNESISSNKKTISNRKKKLDFYGGPFDKKLFFINGKQINNNTKKIEFEWLYKGRLKGRVVNIELLNKDKLDSSFNKILIVDSLNFNLYSIVDKIDGCIIRNGAKFSHNAIVLREYKIPSIINYKNFEELNIGQKIDIDF